MGMLKLFAISADEFRDFFAAPEELAARLRLVGANEFASPFVESKRGPFGFRKRPVETKDPGCPNAEDAENLLTGQYIPPERLVPSWRLLQCWAGAESWGSLELETTAQQVEQIELELVRLGLPAQYALSKLSAHDPQVMIQTPPGLRVGCNSFAHAVDTARELHEVFEDVPPDFQPSVSALLEFLDKFPAWSDSARQSSRPAPDVLGFFWA